jgi:hypothetical protein
VGALRRDLQQRKRALEHGKARKAQDAYWREKEQGSSSSSGGGLYRATSERQSY